MKAVHTPVYGPPSVLEVREIPRPTIGNHEVLVEVHASPVTAGDRRLRAADFPSFTAILGRLMLGVMKPRHPVQGTMFGGRIVEVGSAVTRFAVGDDVFGSADHGAWAEALVMPEDGAMARIPDGVGYDEAAAVPYGGWTAIHFLKEMAQVRPGETVLLLGAAGGVGRYAIQVAKHLGAEVTAVCGRDQFDLVRDLGADDVLDYRTQDFAANGRRYDVIFDIADVSHFRHSRPSLTPTGRYLTLYMSLSAILWTGWTALVGGPAAKFGVAMGGDMAMVADWMSQGVLCPLIAEAFDVEDIAKAHILAESGECHGDIVVTLPSSRDRPDHVLQAL